MLGKVTEALVASTAKENPLARATAMGNRTSAGEGLQREGSGEAVAVVTELGEQSGSQSVAKTGERPENRRIGMLLELDYVFRRPKHDLGNLQDEKAKKAALEILEELKKKPKEAKSNYSLWTKRP